MVALRHMAGVRRYWMLTCLDDEAGRLIYVGLVGRRSLLADWSEAELT